MPEGHTLHRLAHALRPLVGRQVRASSPQGRFRAGAAARDGAVVADVEAHGKHLLVGFGDVHLHVHLGLAGAMFESDPAAPPRAGVRLRLAADDEPRVAWDLVTPIRCELLADAERAALVARLGPDPLRGDDPAPALAAVRRSRRPVGELLLDQAVLAGAGNVFRAEVLHACRVHPSRAGESLTEDELRCIWDTLAAVMRRAEAEGRILTVDTPPEVDRATLPEADARWVYKQDRCRRCGGEVRTWPLGGRTMYACERCQPPG